MVARHNPLGREGFQKNALRYLKRVGRYGKLSLTANMARMLGNNVRLLHASD